MMNQRLTRQGLIIWLVAASFFLYEFLLRTVVGTFQGPISSDLALNSFSFSLVSSTAYIIAYGLMQIPAGFISEKFGLKKTLFYSALVCAISCFLFAFSTGFYTAIFARILMGLASAFSFVCLLVTVFEWLPTQRTALFIGLSQFIGTIGPMAASGPMITLANHHLITWHTLFVLMGCVGILLSLLILAIVKNNHQTIHRFTILKPNFNLFNELKLVIGERDNWSIALFSGLSYFFIEYLSENEGQHFLILNGFSQSFASYMITLAWLCFAIGCPLIGSVSDALKRRVPPMIAASLFSLAAAIGIIYFPNNAILVTAFFIFLGLGAAGQNVGFALVAENCRHQAKALSVGFNNMTIAFVGSINAPLVAIMLSVSRGRHLSTISSYHLAFSFMAVLVIISVFISLFFLKESFAKNIKETTYLNPERSLTQ